MKKKNVKFIDRSQKVECCRCKGKGFILTKVKEVSITGQAFYSDWEDTCPTCDGTGIFKTSSYICVAEKPDGQKSAFGVDQAGK